MIFNNLCSIVLIIAMITSSLRGLEILQLIYIARDGLRYQLGFGFLSYTEIGNRDSKSEKVKVCAV